MAQKIVIDLETGTIVSTKLVVVDVDDLAFVTREALEDNQLSDSDIIWLGENHGIEVTIP